ncbi:hypothetical protein SAMN02799636_05376 [Methylobacterium sp. 275MFSha3.1]|nr:hypothetical protein SAMN02799636_05376 [Methylobacterium sp. 275MFSha3.1]
MAREASTRDAGRRGNPGVGQVRAGSDPRGAPRHRPGMVPGRCRLSRRGVSDVPVLRLPVSGLGRGAGTPYSHAVPAPPEPASAPWPSSRPPPRSGRVRRSLRVGPEAGRRGGISSPAGQSAARSHARVRGTPRTGPSPGAMAAESHRRGRRPVPGPARSATGRAPEGRPGITPGPPRTGAVRKHKIGTLSREAEPRAAVDDASPSSRAQRSDPGRRNIGKVALLDCFAPLARTSVPKTHRPLAPSRGPSPAGVPSRRRIGAPRTAAIDVTSARNAERQRTQIRSLSYSRSLRGEGA